MLKYYILIHLKKLIFKNNIYIYIYYIYIYIYIRMIQPPIYDDTKTVYEYVKELERYNLKINEDKYNKILKFINKLTCRYKIKYLALMNFKNITYLTDTTHNNKILKENGAQLLIDLNIQNNQNNQNNNNQNNEKKENKKHTYIDFDNLDEESLIIFLRKILQTINYTLIKNGNGMTIIKKNNCV